MNDPIPFGPRDKYVEVYGVESSSNPNRIYVVARTAENKWSCSCPRWIYNSNRPECKHIRWTKQWSAARGEAKMLIQPTSQADFAKLERYQAVISKALNSFSLIEV